MTDVTRGNTKHHKLQHDFRKLFFPSKGNPRHGRDPERRSQWLAEFWEMASNQRRLERIVEFMSQRAEEEQQFNRAVAESLETA